MRAQRFLLSVRQGTEPRAPYSKNGNLCPQKTLTTLKVQESASRNIRGKRTDSSSRLNLRPQYT
jgi:hypothetical protein